MTKLFRGFIEVEFDVAKVETPFDLAAKIEAGLKVGASELVEKLGGDVKVTLHAGFTNVRPAKAAPAQPAAQRDIEDVTGKPPQPGDVANVAASAAIGAIGS